MMQHLMNAMKSMTQQAVQSRAATRHGTITSYDPNAYAVKVRLQPDGVETGWMPLKSPWVGKQWGLFCPPSVGDAVEIDYQEDDSGVGSVGWRFFNDTDRPLACPSGEFWLVHQSGSLLKFYNNGQVELQVKDTLTSQAKQWNHTGPMKIDGEVTVTKKITGQSGLDLTGTAQVTGDVTASGNVTAKVNVMASGDVKAGTTSLKLHMHSAGALATPPGGGAVNGITGTPL